jgi:hypothetical protein
MLLNCIPSTWPLRALSILSTRNTRIAWQVVNVVRKDSSVEGIEVQEMEVVQTRVQASSTWTRMGPVEELGLMRPHMSG